MTFWRSLVAVHLSLIDSHIGGHVSDHVGDHIVVMLVVFLVLLLVVFATGFSCLLLLPGRRDSLSLSSPPGLLGIPRNFKMRKDSQEQSGNESESGPIV